MKCKICGNHSIPFDHALILHKFTVQYYHCGGCGFIQTEEPYWLEEAYSSAIARQDVGIVQRNLMNADITSALLLVLFPSVTRSLDFGAGHGMLVRLMRDRGFPFTWSDAHARNEYARGFETAPGESYEFLTAFEVLEHLVDPISDLTTMMTLAQNVFVSTCIAPEPPPKTSEWWYYVPETGQHISFFTPRALSIIAAKFNRHLLSSGTYHLFSKEPKNQVLYRFVTRSRSARILNSLLKRPSLTEGDFNRMRRSSS